MGAGIKKDTRNLCCSGVKVFQDFKGLKDLNDFSGSRLRARDY